jgi:HEAT repeats
MPKKHSAGIYLWYGTGLLAADVVAVWFLDRLFVARSGTSWMQALPIAFCLLHLVTIAMLAGGMVFRKARREIFDTRARMLEPELLEKFSEHSAGIDHIGTLGPLMAADALILEQSLIRFLPCVKGEGRHRLGELAVAFGIVAKWERECKSRSSERRRGGIVALALMPLSIARTALRAALYDKDPEIQILASRGLVQSGEKEEVENIFLFSLKQTLRVRACLTEDFRRHAGILCENTVPKVLAANDAKEILIMFEMLGAWRRSIHLEGWEQMFQNSSGANRATILRLLPYVSSPEEAEAQVIQALADESQEVKTTAASIAAHWELAAAVPALATLLSDAQTDVSRAAAQALSRLGVTGQKVLEDAVLGHIRRGGGAALEALEAFNTGRLSGTAL